MYEALLARVPLFQELSRRELALLADACRERDYAPGEVLAHRGVGVGLLIVVEGSARVARRLEHATGAELEVDRLGQGAVWGESMLLEIASSMTTIIALEPTHAVVLPVWDFHAVLRDNPDLAIHLLATLSRQTQR